MSLMSSLEIDVIDILKKKYAFEYAEICGLNKFIKECKTPVCEEDANYFRGRMKALNDIIDEVTIGLQKELNDELKDDPTFNTKVEKIFNCYRRYKGKRFPPSSPFYQK